MSTPSDTTPTYEDQARACWIGEMHAEERGHHNAARAFNEAGRTCHRADRQADALAMARDILAPLADEKFALGERAVSELIHTAGVWMSLYGRPAISPADAPEAPEPAKPDACPHAAPFVYCEQCKSDPCPMGLGQKSPA